MWEANCAAKAAIYNNHLSSDFDSWRAMVRRERDNPSEEQVLERMLRQCMGERESWRRELIAARGPRYEGCLLKNFESDTEPKRKAVETLREYGRLLPERVANGNGLILFGPKGTGKDHLAMALATHAIMGHGIYVEWVNGMDLFGEFRDAMNDDSKSEQEIISSYVRYQVLYISDPVPPVGALTEFQMQSLFRILDARYNRMRPTWVTVNVTSAAELDTRLGPQNGDRVRDGALAIFCNWASYRKTRQ